MAKIGLKKTDIKTGGQYQDLFYDRVFIDKEKFKVVGAYRVIDIADEIVSWNWFKNNYQNIAWKDLSIFVEIPIALKTNNAPTWVPNRIGTDEGGNEYIKKLEEFQVREDNIAGTKFIVKFKELDEAGITNLIGFESASNVIMLVKEVRDLLASEDYKAPE